MFILLLTRFLATTINEALVFIAKQSLTPDTLLWHATCERFTVNLLDC